MQTIRHFPDLVKNSATLRELLSQEQGSDQSSAHACHLPWSAPRCHHQRASTSALLDVRERYCRRGSRCESFDNLCGSCSSLARGSVSSGSLHGRICTNGDRDGWRRGESCESSLSTHSRKTLASLSASVYDELQPFKRAHHALIKNRIAGKAATRARDKQSERAARCRSPKRTRKLTPLESGLAKITLCASSFAWAYGKRCVRGFQRWRMRPIVFKEQLQMALHIYLRPSEANAVASYFDVEHVGSVNGETFVRWFLRAGNNSRQERLRKQAAKGQEEQKLQRQRQREDESRRATANKSAIGVEYTPDDRAAALGALARVALSYHDQRTGHEAAQRDFACALSPADFRDQLHRSFAIRLTDCQFSALFNMMDINQDGNIDGSEFLRFFFGLGNGERAKEHKQHLANRRVRARNLRLDKLPPIAPALGR